MFNFLSALLHSIFKIIFSNRKDLIFVMMILKRENQIYKRLLNLQKVQSNIKKNDRTRLKWKCSEGHIFENNFLNVKRGVWCPECRLLEKQ